MRSSRYREGFEGCAKAEEEYSKSVTAQKKADDEKKARFNSLIGRVGKQP